MVRSKKVSTSETPTLDAEYWATFGLEENPSTRDKLLTLAFAEISRRGILDVNARWLCDLLELDPSAINYHFGSFDGLIAEVFVLAHRFWQESIAAGTAQPFSSPEDRLRNLLNAQIERAKRYGAVVGLAHLPHVSERVSAELASRHEGALAGVVTYAVTVTAVLIHDMRAEQISDIDLTPQNVPTQWILESMPEAVKSAAHVQWSVVGPTMWMTGAGGGVDEIAQMPKEFSAEVMWPGFIDQLVASVKNEGSN